MAYHGTADVTITSMLSKEYFIKVQAALTLTVDEMQSFYRLFMVPGMGHCSGGRGAWDFGQTYPMHEEALWAGQNALLALVSWVEDGIAPESLIGTKYTNDDVHQPILSQRGK